MVMDTVRFVPSGIFYGWSLWVQLGRGKTTVYYLGGHIHFQIKFRSFDKYKPIMEIWENMKTIRKPVSLFFGMLLACFICSACAFNQSYIQTKGAEKAEITGNYTVFLYGAHHYNDIATVAILAPTDGPHKFDIFATDWAYRSVKGVAGKDAVAMADKFVSWHSSFVRTQTSKILAPSGEIIGYEIRPLYMLTTFGKEDVMYVDYLLKEHNRIEVHIHLDHDVEKKLYGDGADKVRDRHK
jgi:hypothetical protein